MKGALLKGKTIRKVHQKRVLNSSDKLEWSLDAIEFTDGTFLRFVVIEGDGEYGIDPVYPGRRDMKDNGGQ